MALYDAFISYSHSKDKPIAAALQSAIQKLGKPWYRRRALRRMIGAVDPAFNIDDVHREVLDELLREAGIDAFTAEERHAVARRWHELDAWPDFVLALARLHRVALQHLDVAGQPKVTGQRGIQIWIPIAPGPSFEETRSWTEQLSRAIGALGK